MKLVEKHAAPRFRCNELFGFVIVKLNLELMCYAFAGIPVEEKSDVITGSDPLIQGLVISCSRDTVWWSYRRNDFLFGFAL